MTDHEAFYGEYRAVTCEWIGTHDERCRQPNIFGKSYCEHHYPQVFRTSSTDEFEKEVEQDIEESKEIDEVVDD